MIFERIWARTATMAAVRGGLLLSLAALIPAGVSVLVLARAANAGGGFQLTVANHFPHMCKIGVSPVYKLDTAAAVTNSTNGVGTIDFGAGFANADATGRQISGSVQLTVFANAQCDYVLTSTYGALKNVTTGQLGAFRDYYADAHDAAGSGSPVHLNSLSPSSIVNQFTIPAPSGWGVCRVAIEFSIPQTSVPLAAGEYQDVLSLAINPSI